MENLFDENGKYIGLQKNNDYSLTDHDLKEIEKAEKRIKIAEEELQKEIEYQEKKQEHYKIKAKTLKQKINNLTGKQLKTEKPKEKTFIERLGYKKENKGKPTKIDVFMNKYFDVNQRIIIYSIITIISFALIMIKVFGII